MLRKAILVLIAGLLLASSAFAQNAAWRFRWQPGQVLTYKVEQSTSVSEVIDGNRTESRTKLNLTKRWQVTAVDAAGVATVQLSLTALRNEVLTPSGETLLFDSAAPDKSHPQVREQLSVYVGPVLAVLRVDAKGKVVEVKESKFGAASKYEAEPPFTLTLGDGDVKTGHGWERAYAVTLEPPQGTGTKFEAVQKYTCKAVAANSATVAFTTGMKTQPDALADRTPLLQFQPDGEVVFDPVAGVVRSVRSQTDKEIKGHQGEGSSYRFQTTYAEQLAN
jgi:hypothetical protein